MRQRPLQLTPELVAIVHRVVEDAGPEPGLIYHSEADYDEVTRGILSQHVEDTDFWLFAYGSLIWKPEFEHSEERAATAHGWRRSFCVKATRSRGTIDQPGLVMMLDRGGQCNGVVFRIDRDRVAYGLGKLVRREMDAKLSSQVPRWITAATQKGKVKALAFVSNPKAPDYAGGLTIEQVADTLSIACGPWGSGADYLYNTVHSLRNRGIHDSYLWRLQSLVADRIVATNERLQCTRGRCTNSDPP